MYILFFSPSDHNRYTFLTAMLHSMPFNTIRCVWVCLCVSAYVHSQTGWFIKEHTISIGLNADVWLKVEFNVLLARRTRTTATQKSKRLNDYSYEMAVSFDVDDSASGGIPHSYVVLKSVSRPNVRQKCKSVPLSFTPSAARNTSLFGDNVFKAFSDLRIQNGLNEIVHRFFFLRVKLTANKQITHAATEQVYPTSYVRLRTRFLPIDLNHHFHLIHLLLHIITRLHANKCTHLAWSAYCIWVCNTSEANAVNLNTIIIKTTLKDEN